MNEEVNEGMTSQGHGWEHFCFVMGEGIVFSCSSCFSYFSRFNAFGEFSGFGGFSWLNYLFTWGLKRNLVCMLSTGDITVIQLTVPRITSRFLLSFSPPSSGRTRTHTVMQCLYT